MIDLHCHILPGLDDGAASLEESLEMARTAREDGITTIVATPHLFRANFSNDNFALVSERRQLLAEAIAANNIAIEIASGAEVYISHRLIDIVRNHRNDLVINGSSYMFIEFPSSHVFPNPKNLVFELMSEGISPIIAHPERNSVFARQPDLLYDLVQMGVLAQANSGSLTGLYGREAGEAVLKLLRLNLIHFLASDAHNAKSIPPRLSEAVGRAEALVGKEGARCLVFDNPRAVLDNRNIPYWPPASDPRKSKKALSLRIPGFLRRGRHKL